jgi:hypothetical protein
MTNLSKSKTRPKENLKSKKPKTSLQRYADIPDLPLENFPDEIYNENPRLARSIIAKRGLKNAYEEGGTEAAQCIKDMLIDLRHLCDFIDLSFNQLHRSATWHYLQEKKHDMK